MKVVKIPLDQLYTKASGLPDKPVTVAWISKDGVLAFMVDLPQSAWETVVREGFMEVREEK